MRRGHAPSRRTLETNAPIVGRSYLETTDDGMKLLLRVLGNLCQLPIPLSDLAIGVDAEYRCVRILDDAFHVVCGAADLEDRLTQSCEVLPDTEHADDVAARILLRGGAQ